MAYPQPFGRYILDERVAMGGMAEIFRAHTNTEGFEKQVCIKRVLPHFLDNEDFVTMFRDEAAVAARLQHANVVQVFDFGEVDGALFLAMEFVEGKDLNALLKVAARRSEYFKIGQAVQIAIDMCRGLYHAHSAQHRGKPLNVVHRDISPHNILVSTSGEVKVTDFGIAKAAERATHTNTGVVKGKLSYMAPEQLEGGDIDHRVDQFAVGLVLWQMLTNQKALSGESEATILRKVMTCDIPPPRVFRKGIPDELEQILMQALSPSRDERHADMRAFERALTKFLFGFTDDPAETDVAALYARMATKKKRPPTTMLPKQDPPQTPPQSPAPAASALPGANVDDEVSLQEARQIISAENAPEKTSSDVFAKPSTGSGSGKQVVATGEAADAAAATAFLDGESGRHLPAEGGAVSGPFPANAGEDTRMLGDDGVSEVFSRPVADADATSATGVSHAALAAAGVDAVEPPSSTPKSRAPMFAALGLLGVAGVVGAVLMNDSSNADAHSPPALEAKVTTSVKPPAESPKPTPVPAEVAAAAPKLDVEVPVGAAPPDVEPAPEPSKKATKRSGRRRGRGSKAKPKTTTKASKPAKVEGTGRVFVDVEGTWADVLEYGKKIGRTPFNKELPVGKHRLTLKNPESGKSKTVTITVVKGGKHPKILKGL